MGKRKPPRHTRNKEPQPGMPSLQSTPKKPLVRTLEWTIGVISLVLTVVGFVLNSLPKLSVDASGSLRPADPMGTVFNLSNDGLLPVHDLTVTCGIKKIQTQSGGGMENIGFQLPGSEAKILSPGHKMTLPCAHAVAVTTNGAVKAEIIIFVDYRPDWLWWHKNAGFPLEVEETQNGQWIWKSIPQ